MSKGQKRSNRELKKPKQNKPKTAAATGTMGAAMQGKSDLFAQPRKK